MRKIALYALYLFFFSVPCELVLILPGVGSFSRLMGGLALLTGMAGLVATGRLRGPVLFHGIAATFVLWAGLTFFWSLDKALSVGQLSTFLQLLVMLWLIWVYAATREQQHRMMQAFVFGAFFAALATVYEYLTAGYVIGEMRYRAFDSDANETGVTLALAIPMAWYLTLEGSRRWLAWGNRIFIALACYAIVLTASRTAFIVMVVALAVIPLTVQGLSAARKLTALVVLVLSGVVLAYYAPETSWNRISTIQREITEGDLNKRELIWRAGLEVVRRHPLTGVGVGAFREGVEVTTFNRYVAHNSFLSVLVEQGIVGFLLFAGMFAYLFFRTWAMPRLPRRVWLVTLAVLVLGASTLTWEYKKPTWIVMALLLTQQYAHGAGMRPGASTYAPGPRERPRLRGPLRDRGVAPRPAGTLPLRHGVGS